MNEGKLKDLQSEPTFKESGETKVHISPLEDLLSTIENRSLESLKIENKLAEEEKQKIKKETDWSDEIIKAIEIIMSIMKKIEELAEKLKELKSLAEEEKQKIKKETDWSDEIIKAIEIIEIIMSMMKKIEELAEKLKELKSLSEEERQKD